MTIAESIAAWAQSAPTLPAILSPERDDISYGDLVQHLRSAGDMLYAMGIGPGDRVAMVLPNGAEMAVAFLGIAASATAAPLNPAYSSAEFEFYFEDLKPRALVVAKGVESRARDVASARRVPIIETDTLDSGAPLFAYSAPGTTTQVRPGFARPGDIALILHTSGTTARPKMVAHTQAALCLSAQNIATSLELTQSDRCLNVMPLFHVHGLLASLLASLTAGGSVVCAPGFLAPQFLSWLGEYGATWYSAMPTIHQAVVARAATDRATAARHSLRFIRSASAALDPSVANALEETFGVPVIEAYGMTEASHQVASNPVGPRNRKSGSVGLPTGCEAAVANADGMFLTSGETGEIIIRGPAIISGYVQNDEANRNSFIGDWFRTGDSGYIDADGYIFLTGRIKEIISRGAEKISPAEIERVLAQHPAVAQAVVFAIPDQRLGEDVGAAVVAKAGAEIDTRLLRLFVAEQLADFKVPRVVHVVDAIPLGRTGKIQRSRLAEQLALVTEASDAPTRTSATPRSAREMQLANIWCDVLGISSVGIDDDFFLIGGDSILATILMVRAAQMANRPVSLVDFVTAPTITGMLAAIDSEYSVASEGLEKPGLIAIQPYGTARPVFCLPPMDGSLLGFARLAPDLGRDQPLWGFAPRSPTQGNWSYTIEDLAAGYLGAMRQQQATGPYTLMGDCFGGFVAYEMASQLRRAGEEVELLVMVDTFLYSGWQRQWPLVVRLANRVRHGARRARFQVQTLRAMHMGEHLPYLIGRARAFSENLRHRVRQTLYNTSVRRGIDPPIRARDARYANIRAEQLYSASAYTGRALLFKTTSPSAAVYPSRLMGWEELLTGRAEAVEVPGGHQSRFLAGAVDAIAERLRPELKKAAVVSAHRVSIGLPVHNGGEFLAQSIESILAQTFTDFELIIVDNGSTDNTPDICERYTDDPRVRYVRIATNMGAAANFNRTLQLATGEYFKWAAHDDLIEREWLENCVRVLDKDSGVVLCQSGVKEVDRDGRTIAERGVTLGGVESQDTAQRFSDLVLTDHDCTHIFGLIRAATLRRTSGFAPYIASDRVLLAELGLLGRFASVGERLFSLRQHAGRSVSATPFHNRSHWFGPAKRVNPVFPHWRMFGEYLLLARRVNHDRATRWRCYRSVFLWPTRNWNWARLLSDFVIAISPRSSKALTALGRRLVRKD